MKVVVVTQEDPFYLPIFFQRFLRQAGQAPVEIEHAFLLSPFDEGWLALLKRMWSFHGPVDFVRRGLRYAYKKAGGALGREHASVASVLEGASVPWEACDDINQDTVIERLERLSPDVILSVASPQIFSEELLEIARWGCLNVHSAPLPEYRGMMPNFWQMLHGEESAGITVHRMSPEIDRGQAVRRGEVAIEPEDSLDDLIKRSKREAADVTLDALFQIHQGAVEMEPIEDEGSYFSFPSRDDVRRLRNRGHDLL